MVRSAPLWISLIAVSAQALVPMQAPVTRARPAASKIFEAVALTSFDQPWALGFLPDGRMLVTEKMGRMLLLSADGKSRKALTGIPEVNSSGQGALGEVVPHPDFASNRLVYFSYSAPGASNAIVLARGKLTETKNGARLSGVTTIYQARPAMRGGHYAGRIAFSPDGHLFFSTGERQKFKPAQDRGGVLGKILRLTVDGKPAPGNPLAAKGFDPAVWSYGHRNPLGLAFDAEGRLWEVEMGPRGGDEINLIQPGRNYGWPFVSNGDHYDGRSIPDHSAHPEFEAPRVSWNPVISPGSLLIYSGKLFPQWRGKALIGGLSSETLIVADIDANGRSGETARFAMGKGIRAVDQGPDGAVYLLEDGPGGRLLKLTPRRR